jgi:hypothetical protein
MTIYAQFDLLLTHVAAVFVFVVDPAKSGEIVETR